VAPVDAAAAKPHANATRAALPDLPEGETRAADAVAREAVGTVTVPAMGLDLRAPAARRVMRPVPPPAARDRFRSRRPQAPHRAHPIAAERGKRIFHNEENADQRNSA
jgi:hypothetical protein